VPGGRHFQFRLAPSLARRRAFRAAGVGARGAGGRAASLLLLVSVDRDAGRGGVTCACSCLGRVVGVVCLCASLASLGGRFGWSR